MAKDDKILGLLLDKVVSHSQMINISSWRTSNYKHLSQQIEESTGEVIHHRTLKRIYDSYNGSKERTPTVSTLNILSRYVGYDSWHDFEIEKLKESNGLEPILTQSDNDSVFKKYWVVFIAPFTISLLGIFYLFFSLSNDKKEEIKASFDESFYTANANKYATIKVNRSTSNDQDLIILASKVGSTNSRVFELPKGKTSYSERFREPGLFKLKLLKDSMSLDEMRYFVLSKKWQYTVYSKGIGKDYKDASFSNGSVLIDHQRDNNEKLDTVNYRSELVYTNLIPILTDNALIQFRAKAHFPIWEGCGMYKVVLYGKEQNVTVVVTEDKCHNETVMRIGETKLDGRVNELPTLKGNYSMYNDFEMSFKNNQFTLKQNDLEISMDYTKRIDTLMGFKFWFIGGGELDYIRVKDNTGNLVYSEGFE